MSLVLLALAAVAATFGVLTVSTGGTETSGEASTPAGAAARVFAAGDIAVCDRGEDEQTARLLAADPAATILTLGDNAYHSGLAEEFAACYEASWGRHKERTRPTAGNHEYARFVDDARPYFEYFGRRAGELGQGYYSFDLAGWHLIALNSNCSAPSVGGCGAGSSQEQWLRRDLAANERLCTLAYWHHPRFSAGSRHGSHQFVRPLWDALYEAGADVVLSGHEHNYQRYAPQTPAGEPDPERGIRQFVVGTAGAPLYPLGQPISNLEAQAATHGVLALTLGAGRYRWQFVPVPGERFRDSGSGRCH